LAGFQVATYGRFWVATEAYRDVEVLLLDRGMSADHVTVWRWVQRYAPELDRRLRSHL
jgi:transposase-like protein